MPPASPQLHQITSDYTTAAALEAAAPNPVTRLTQCDLQARLVGSPRRRRRSCRILLLLQPLSLCMRKQAGLGRGGSQAEAQGDSKHHGGRPFKKEQPVPAAQAANSIHCQDGGGQWGTNHLGQCGAGGHLGCRREGFSRRAR